VVCQKGEPDLALTVNSYPCLQYRRRKSYDERSIWQQHGVSGLLAMTDGLKTDQPAPFPVHVSDCTQKRWDRLQHTCCCFLLAMVGGRDSCRPAACLSATALRFRPRPRPRPPASAHIWTSALSPSPHPWQALCCTCRALTPTSPLASHPLPVPSSPSRASSFNFSSICALCGLPLRLRVSP
jgi:hypothetical protein